MRKFNENYVRDMLILVLSEKQLVIPKSDQ